MAIQVVHVANPPAGSEWQYTIPGQYNVTLIGVQATITTHSPPVSSTDQSGNGNTLTYNPLMFPDETFGVTGPFGSGGGLAVDCTNYDSITGASLGSAPNGGGQFDLGTFTFEVVVQCKNTGNISQVLAMLFNPAETTFRAGIGIDRGGTFLHALASVSDRPSLGVGLLAGNWGQLAATYDGSQWIGYANGVAGSAVVGHPPTTSLLNKPLQIMGDGRTTAGINGLIAAASYFSGALSGTRIAAHNTAIATSAAAYRTAVLADSPVAFWMLADGYVTAARAVVLAIQNGAATVATFPVTVPLTTPGTFTYSWQTLGPGALTSADGTVITVPIPTMTLPPGYTIGSNTLDLTSTDQWSNITLWYDDGTGTPNPAGQNPPYLNALLVPTTWAGAQ